MKKIFYLLVTPLLISFLFNFSSCEDDPPKKEEPSGMISFAFEHTVDGQTVEWDNMKYTNAAGNNYELSNVQWFVSDVTLIKDNGAEVLLNNWEFSHYIDSDIPGSMSWDVVDKVPTGTYDSVVFTFGIKGSKNEPFMFVNYPESAMFWPLHLGGDSGGYHYMKLNGFWMDSLNRRSPFEFHLGVGQAQDANGNRITNPDGSYVFVQNWFEVRLSKESFELVKDGHKEVTIRMNMENWFENPNTYDHNAYGADIMENQAAQKAARENGHDVFSITQIKDVQ